jgi:glycosyltransferase involved in cell wall biosynthesis
MAVNFVLIEIRSTVTEMVGKKYKILMLSDHALSTSGVGTQSRHLINGLLNKGCWSIRQFGAAMKHDDYNVVKISDDFIIKPIDGFGSKEMLRLAIATEKPDIIFIFTDPRFYYWLFEMEDEIHQVCPIVYWHVWDNKPYPEFNDAFYQSTDLINCHSYHTYQQLVERHPDKTNFVPHAIPENIFYEVSESKKLDFKKQVLGDKKLDHFVGFWMNRNARRKRPGDLLLSWKTFLDKLEKTTGSKKASLLMHTDPMDVEGPNLFAMVEMLGIVDNVVFSNRRVGFEHVNAFHNIADFTINVSYAEGFGLSTLEAMMTKTPIIAPLTGGQTRQVIDHRDGTENGFALPIELRTLVGSQNVPYIFEDYTSVKTIADKIWKMYELGPSGRAKLGQKAYEYAISEFGYQKTIDLWHHSMLKTISTWKTKHKYYTVKEI